MLNLRNPREDSVIIYGSNSSGETPHEKCPREEQQRQNQSFIKVK